MRAILTYHSIDRSGSPISVAPDAFAGHVAWLASGRVRVTGLAELLAMPDDCDAVALTFDDGFENFAAVAAPQLLRHGLAATLFVVPGFVGRTNAWTHDQPAEIPLMRLMDWQTVREMAACGFTVAAHTMTHANLTRLPPDRIRDEMTSSIAAIEHETGARPRLFAYPYGAVSPVAASIAGGVVDAACTTEFRCLRGTDAPPLLPRLDMYYFQRPDGLDAWGTSRFSWYLRVRGQARRVRARLARTA
jgi:peptidoglycan/xylan/chitin deacetylase (PgdA/CDA1 family)